ncbi:MAG: DUF2256 and DUF3253 domain-containing protein [Naasia sp.]
MGRQRGDRVGSPPESKICASCGREITWRKKWERDWDEVKYCSDACRSRGAQHDSEYEKAILDLLAQRAAGATICPSEIARAARPESWREEMEPVRRAARRLVAAGEVEITQKGSVVDPSRAKGPIRIRRTRRGDGS